MPPRFPNAKPDSQYDYLRELARDRLYPSLMDPNYLVLRARRIIFSKWIETLGARDLMVLDVGGRYQPYRALLAERIGRYVAVDIMPTKMVTVLGSGECLPFAENTFDVAIATQVFDCFTRPDLGAEQIHMVLKPGGILLMSVPAMAPRFADVEKWRFTAGGIRSTLSLFERIEVIPELSSLGGLVRTINVGLHACAQNGAMQKAYDVMLCPLFNLLGLSIEALGLTRNDQFAPNYSVLAVK